MAAAFGLATIAWSPLGGGVLTGKYCKAGRHTGMGGWLFHAEDTSQKIAIVNALEAIAEEIYSNAGRVAIAWIIAKGRFRSSDLAPALRSTTISPPVALRP
jgi:aryl-alcohol dehydrogenase-like predicted oxidoreductase